MIRVDENKPYILALLYIYLKHIFHCSNVCARHIHVCICDSRTNAKENRIGVGRFDVCKDSFITFLAIFHYDFEFFI